LAASAYNSYYMDLHKGRINVDSSVFKAILLNNTYTFSKDAHTTRANLTGEVSGTGYTSGGVTVTATLTQDLATDKATLTFSAFSLPNSTLTGVRQVVYYVANGGAASGDFLVACVNFEADYTYTNQPFNVAAATVSISNPN
jgi:hypothetical protein